MPPARIRTEEDALVWLWRKRFSDDGLHADCPKCQKQRKFRRYQTKTPTRSWFCPTCTTQVTVTAGTFMAYSQLSVLVWFRAIRLVVAGATQKELQRQLAISQPAAFRVQHKVKDWIDAGGAWPDERHGYPREDAPSLRIDRPYYGRHYKPHCSRGHTLEGDNLYVAPNGRSFCRACDRVRKMKTRARCEVCDRLLTVHSKQRGYRLCSECLATDRRLKKAEVAQSREVASAPEVAPSVVKVIEQELPSAAPVVPKQQTTDGRRLWLSDKQKALLRLLVVAPRPLSNRALSQLFERLPRTWIGFEQDGVRLSLLNLYRRGLVQRLPNDNPRYGEPHYFWCVAGDVASEPNALTLTDALRESELAALVAEQERELARGDWAETDFRTRSLDAPLGDDGSWHDILEDVA